MRLSAGMGLLVWAGLLCAQTPGDPDLAGAQANLARLRELVEAGAMPRAQLERAERVLADAQDAAYLRRTLYGAELTEEQAGEMAGVAARRLDRRNQDLERARQLVQEGVASQASLGTFLEELDRASKEYDLALSRAKLFRELGEMARAEERLQQHLEQSPAEARHLAERFDGDGIFHPRDLARVETAFEREFSRSLPVSARGETAVHRALGFDHRGRVDVAINPDQPEGVWLRQYLTSNRIPYFAFRQAVPGKATGAHIHIGPVSGRLQRGG